MRERVMAHIGLAALLVSCISPNSTAGEQVAVSTHQGKKVGGMDDSLPHPLNLPINSAPVSILSFHLPARKDNAGEYQWPVRLAVLSTLPTAPGIGLQIFKPEGADKLTAEFSIRPPETEEWGKLESFPSDHSYPGLVIRGNYTELAEHGGPLTIALCYFNGTFRVVFRGGYANFISITERKMPEAVEYVSAEMGSRTNTRVRVWTWDGKKYQPVSEIAYKALFSPQLIRAIEAVQGNGEGSATKPRNRRLH